MTPQLFFEATTSYGELPYESEEGDKMPYLLGINILWFGTTAIRVFKSEIPCQGISQQKMMGTSFVLEY